MSRLRLGERGSELQRAVTGSLSPQPPPLPENPPALEMRPRLRPVFFGEGIEVNPEPTHEIR